MYHRVDADQVADLDVAHVSANRRHLPALRTQGAGLEEIRIESHDLVTGTRQYVDHHRPDKPVVSRYQYSHRYTSRPSPSPVCSDIGCTQNSDLWCQWPEQGRSHPGPEARSGRESRGF